MNDKPRCDHCRHWQAQGVDFDCFVEAGNNFKHWGRCGLAMSENGIQTTDPTLAVARDAEGWSAWLQTAPGFGCVLFEACSEEVYQRRVAEQDLPPSKRTPEE